MDRLHELIAILSDKQVMDRTFQARQEQICKICQKPVAAFTNTFSEYEYSLSTICEDCQKYFGIIPNRFN